MKLNGYNASNGTVRVHRADCADCAREAKKFDQVSFAEEFDSQESFGRDYWDNGILSEHEAEYGVGSFDVFAEMEFLNCTSGLPRYTPKEGTEMTATTNTPAVRKTAARKTPVTPAPAKAPVARKAPVVKTPVVKAPVARKTPVVKTPVVKAPVAPKVSRVRPSENPGLWALQAPTANERAMYEWAVKLTGTKLDLVSFVAGRRLQGPWQKANRENS